MLLCWAIVCSYEHQEHKRCIPFLQLHRAVVRLGYGRVGHIGAREGIFSVVGGKPGVYLSNCFSSSIGPHEQWTDVTSKSVTTHD